MIRLIFVLSLLALQSCGTVTDYCAEVYNPVRAAARVIGSTATQFPIPDVCKAGKAVLDAVAEVPTDGLD